MLSCYHSENMHNVKLLCNKLAVVVSIAILMVIADTTYFILIFCK